MDKKVDAFLRNRWRRQVIGRAYETAREVSEMIPANSSVLDVGCGHGFIAYHMSQFRDAAVIGLDLAHKVDAPIKYVPYAGDAFPLADASVDSVLLCYVLHHSQDIDTILSEVTRVLRENGTVVVYEDVPEIWWDRIPLWIHNWKWESRTGPCTFRTMAEWQEVFRSYRFEVIQVKKVSRWNFLLQPVNHVQYVLRYESTPASGH
jgi:ubiquinone/menaquinone biosynthesis C-methylase UbiE